MLTNFNNFSQWNPFIRQIIGEPKVGTKLQINLLTSSGKTRFYNPTITKVEPLHELRWIGNSLFQEYSTGNGFLLLNLIKSNQVRFGHIEIFKGLGVSLSGSRLDEDVKSFEKMNNAFKEKVELVEG